MNEQTPNSAAWCQRPKSTEVPGWFWCRKDIEKGFKRPSHPSQTCRRNSMVTRPFSTPPIKHKYHNYSESVVNSSSPNAGDQVSPGASWQHPCFLSHSTTETAHREQRSPWCQGGGIEEYMLEKTSRWLSFEALLTQTPKWKYIILIL